MTGTATAKRYEAQHDNAMDRTRNSLARIEAMIANTAAASRKYLPAWEKPQTSPVSPASSSGSYKPSLPKKNPTRRSEKARPASTWKLHSKTEWSPLPASPKLSGKSFTQTNGVAVPSKTDKSTRDEKTFVAPASSSDDNVVIVVQTAPAKKVRRSEASSASKSKKTKEKSKRRSSSKGSSGKKKSKKDKAGTKKKESSQKRESRKAKRRNSLASTSENVELDFSEIELDQQEGSIHEEDLCFFTESDGMAGSDDDFLKVSHVFEDDTSSFPSFLHFPVQDEEEEKTSGFAKDSRKQDTTESTEMMDETSVGSLEVIELEEFETEQARVETQDQDDEVDEQDTEMMMRVLILTYSSSSDRRVASNLVKAKTILDYVGVDNFTVDGADPKHELTRNDLCGLSERWTEYPQFFHVVGDEACFLGGMKEFTRAVDKGRFGEWLVEV